MILWKKKNKGFILIELLIVAVFTASLFTFLYVNILPIIGDYEQKEKYDTIDTKYVLYDLRKEFLTYDSNGTNGLWDEIKKEVNTKGFARLYEYKRGNIQCNSTIFKDGNTGATEEEKQDKAQYNNYNTLLKAYHIKSLYITRFGLGSYADGITLPTDYKNLKSLMKKESLLKSECGNLCETDNGNYAQITEEYIKKMKNFTLGYEYKKEYYRMIACMYPLDISDTYCGTIEIIRK